MKDLIFELAQLVAPSGAEGSLAEHLLSHVKEQADEAYVDTLGNAIAVKNGSGPHVSLVAHMDEIGLMVIHIEDNGFLRVISVGSASATSFIGQPFVFSNGVRGVVEASPKVKLTDLGYDDLFIDIGATSREEAEERVFIGLSGVIDAPVQTLTENRIAGRALDNRVGCAIALEAFRTLAQAGRHVSVVFTAQETVGARGALTATVKLQPDLALIVGAAPACDSPDAPRMDLKLGAGPAIKVMDGTAIVPLSVKHHLEESAKRAEVSVQYEVWPRGLSDAGAVQRSVHGIRVGGVSYPARYTGRTISQVDLQDADNALKLVIEAAKSFS